MRRREFTKLLSVVAAWPLTAIAQQTPEHIRLVAILSSIGISDQPREGSFRKRLAELGWREGTNVRFEIRHAEADINCARGFAVELAAMKPDVFLVTNTQMTQLVLANTHDIPIVFISVPDPIGSGLVTSFARPGGRVTGFTNFEPSIGGKWLQFLRDVDPALDHAFVVLDPTNPTAALYEKAIKEAALTLAVKLNPILVRDSADIEAAAESFAREPNGGLLVPPSSLSVLVRDQIIALAARHRLPAIYPYGEFADAGGLMTYGIDLNFPYQEAASYVARILKGESAGNLPVQAPTKFELTINVKTARTLGLSIPRSMLLVADKVIE